MARSKETFNKKEVRKKQEKKRKDKEQRKLAKKDSETSGNLNDMIAYVDEFGNITSTPPEHQKEVINAEDIEISIPKKTAADVEDPTRQGTVSFFNDSKGYGFIRDSETKESVFVHANNLLEDIKEGNLVSFEKEKGPRGPSAIKVKIVK